MPQDTYIEAAAVPADSGTRTHAALNKSSAHFYRAAGANLLDRTAPFLRWQEARLATELWPYSRILGGAPGALTCASDEAGHVETGVNFASQDYLSLSGHPRIIEAAIRALRDFGAHSAGSPMLMGNTTLTETLQNELASAVQTEHVLLFPSGWAAGFGAITALVRSDDYVVIDHVAHACLHQGANAATTNVLRHEHLDIEAVHGHLRAIRAKDTKHGVLVVTEGLFSMDSDSPQIGRMQELCHEYDATLLVDVAHDFGALGTDGGGHLELQSMLGKVDLVMGAFSKTFASNGGFVATHSPAVKQYLKVYGGPHIFSNALSPMQAAVVSEALRIVRSPEGALLRNRLTENILALRSAFDSRGIRCLGDPSPIVPVPIGSEKVARTASGILFRRGVFANLVEFPAVGIGTARFRMQVMAAHTAEQIAVASREVAETIRHAELAFERHEPVYAVVRQPLTNNENGL